MGMANATESIRRSGKFQKGYNAGTATCRICKKLTQKGIWESSCEMCQSCYDEAGKENEHMDGWHDMDQHGPDKTCPMCQAEGAPVLKLGHTYVEHHLASWAGRCDVCRRIPGSH